MHYPLKGVRPSRKNAYCWAVVAVRRAKLPLVAYILIRPRVYKTLAEAQKWAQHYTRTCDILDYQPMQLGFALQTGAPIL